MKILRFVAERGNERFEILEDPGAGFYVYRYLEGRSTHDYLQKDLPMAYLCAEKEWNVPNSAWRPASEGELICELKAPKLKPDGPRISFGDNVRILAAAETEALGVAGVVGQVYGYTKPSVTGVSVVGKPTQDYAINVHFEQRKEGLWFVPELIEFVDHAPGTEVRLGKGGNKWVRSASGEWTKVEEKDEQKKGRWKFW